MTHATIVPAEAVDEAMQRVDRLPALNAVAVRLLQVTSAADASTREVIRLLDADPALAASVLKACRCSERGRSARIGSVERAVVLLGFKAVRSIALSVQFFALLDGVGRTPGAFDRRVFWRHCLAVSVAAERIAKAAGSRVDPAEAGLAGLLHDLGHLALHAAMPEAFDRIARAAEATGETIDAACRRAMGMDTHTVGRRVAERWALPEPLVEAIWLGGMPPDGTEPVHAALVATVTLADAVAREQQVCHAGHGPIGPSAAAMAESLGLDPRTVTSAASGLHRAVSERASSLGLGEEPTETLLLSSLARANEALARINAELGERREVEHPLLEAVESVQRFLADAPKVGERSVADCVAAIARSAASMLDLQEVTIVRPPRGGQPWRLDRCAADGSLAASGNVGGSKGDLPIHDAGRLRRLAAQLLRCGPDEDAELLVLSRGGRVEAAIAVPMDRLEEGTRKAVELVAPLWASALAAAQRDEEATRLAERFAESARAVVEAQEELSRSRTLASVGEMAAGAAHEMNNPLAVICGRSQVIASRLDDPELRAMAEQVAECGQQLSDMITALRQTAEPVQLRRLPCPLAQIVRDAVAQAAADRSLERVALVISDEGDIDADPVQLCDALAEVVVNALDSSDVGQVAVRVQTDPIDSRWIIHVADRGPGLSERALLHAFDPFFSEKNAGRRAGLGLARARRLIEAHGGHISLRNGPEGGAVATIVLPPAERQAQSGRSVA
ncbi:MAG: HDOD domain-containing protein [Phycisphaerales bacterium]|nr:HDOD domain-containing protein [Phycisphaerales bacterium]